MVNAQEYLDQNYPKEKRLGITTLNISSQDLEDSLNLSDFPNLEELDCSDNRISEIVFAEPSYSTRLAKKQKITKKLKKLDLSNNDFLKKDSSFLKDFIELEELCIANSRLFGSLESLKNMTELKVLDISGTDIDSGLECLPTSLKKIYCLLGTKKNLKIKVISDLVGSLFRATSENKIEEAKEIIEKKNLKTINFYDERDNTLLHYATQKDCLPLLELLINKRGDIDAADRYGWSVLHSAVLWIVNDQGDWNIIELLLRNGVDTSAGTDNGLTARDIFFQKDYSYIEQYDNLVERVFQQVQILAKEK